jgi:hypothetical protein
MARESNTGLGVSQIYGPRDTGHGAGQYPTSGVTRELAVQLTGGLLGDLLLDPIVIPAGAAITKATLNVTEAFALATSSVVEVGTDGSEATNGVSLTEAQLEAVGHTDVTTALAGTWDAEARLAANTTLGLAFSAGSVTDTSVGRASLVIEYFKVV